MLNVLKLVFIYIIYENVSNILNEIKMLDLIKIFILIKLILKNINSRFEYSD